MSPWDSGKGNWKDVVALNEAVNAEKEKPVGKKGEILSAMENGLGTVNRPLLNSVSGDENTCWSSQRRGVQGRNKSENDLGHRIIKQGDLEEDAMSPWDSGKGNWKDVVALNEAVNAEKEKPVGKKGEILSAM
ncbi:hypothetical protein TREES_T100015766 [Tupaia chinensis]|uniref:Uncharacterized protein n=1 Tax=Tupaia chinensis TaxID=246437 RepID=L9L7L4_TUPCH|nr:hypothetical protein TREES_T100015766 [Tupaia chinensis]